MLMPKKIFVTRNIPDKGINMLRAKGYEVDISPKDRILSKKEVIKWISKKPYDAVLCLLTDTIDKDVFAACPTAKIFANYAVGFNNINVNDAKAAGVMITNTPGGLTDTVAEHAIALMFALTCRVCEGDAFTKRGKYAGWDPLLFLGTDVKGKTLGILGTGNIGSRVAKLAKGLDMNIVYYDVKRNEALEQLTGAQFHSTVEDVLKAADVVSIHVPLLDSTKHLINAERLQMMKRGAYLINTSRGPVVDEAALVDALQKGVIRGAGLDVFENEPNLAKGLAKLSNVVLTPHTASATESTRQEMSFMAANNIIEFLEGRTPPNAVK
jgi:glyoxylate reductase